MSQTAHLIQQLKKTSAPISAKTVRQIIAELTRLQQQDQVLDNIREAAGVAGCSENDLPVLVHDIISNLATQNAILAAKLEPAAPQEEKWTT